YMKQRSCFQKELEQDILLKGHLVSKPVSSFPTQTGGQGPTRSSPEDEGIIATFDELCSETMQQKNQETNNSYILKCVQLRPTMPLVNIGVFIVNVAKDNLSLVKTRHTFFDIYLLNQHRSSPDDVSAAVAKALRQTQVGSQKVSFYWFGLDGPQAY
ncbi:hypothetical protein STEG23_033714, partial [Scotinomys teguina]